MFGRIRRLSQFVSRHPLTRDRKLAALARVTRWQLESRFKSEVVVPWIEGTRLAAQHGMHGATGNIYAGLYDFADMAFLLHFLRPADLFIDVGANVGSYTVLASGVCKARSLAFEPDPQTFAQLQKNIALNELGHLAQAHCAALGDIQGAVNFTVGRGTMNMVTEASDEVQQVAMSTLDLELEARGPCFIKLDVEGYEANVLKGAKAALSLDPLKAILSECRSEPVRRLLSSHGFDEYKYDPFQRTLSPLIYQDGNTLFLRDADFARARVAQSRTFRVLDRAI